MAIKRNTRVEATFTMSSMTDIVFLLLIFFLVTSTLINPNALKLLLPKSTNQISDKAQVSLSIKHYPQAGTFSYHINGNNHAVPYSEIERQLQEFLQTAMTQLFLCTWTKRFYGAGGPVMNIAKEISTR